MIGKRVCSTDLGGTVETVAHFEEMPGGIGLLSSGTLLVVGMSSARLYAIHDGRAEACAELHQIAGGHLDDMVVASNDIAYVGAVGTMTAKAKDAPPGGGIVRVTPGGAARLLATDMAFPNGMVMTADGRTLLVNETFAERITAFDIDDVGVLSNRRTGPNCRGCIPTGSPSTMRARRGSDAIWNRNSFGCSRAGKLPT
jgi:sugar lactone lactonase YvrE